MYRDARAYRKKLLKVKEVAYCLDCCNKTVIKYIKMGLLEGYQAGENCAWLVTTESVLKLQGMG